MNNQLIKFKRFNCKIVLVFFDYELAILLIHIFNSIERMKMMFIFLHQDDRTI